MTTETLETPAPESIADPLHLAMADRELDTAYDHLTAARSGADYDAAAYQGDDHETPPLWLGLSFLGLAVAIVGGLVWAGLEIVP